jgi:hypothetical protein
MKKLVVTTCIFVALGLASCGMKGWTGAGIENLKKSCEKKGTIDCDCYVNKVKAKYPNQIDFNKNGGKDQELAAEIIKDCSLTTE